MSAAVPKCSARNCTDESDTRFTITARIHELAPNGQRNKITLSYRQMCPTHAHAVIERPL